MALPAYQDKGTAVGSIDAIDVAWPTHQAGDIGILVVEISGNNTMSAPSGWTYVKQIVDVSSTAGSQFNVLWKRATSSSEADVTIADTGNHQLGQIYTFRNCISSGTPIESYNATRKTTASTTATVPTLTTTVADTLLVMCISRPNDSSSTTEFSSPTNANLTSLTEQGEAGTTAGNGGGFCVITGVKSTAGSTGTTTVTQATSTTNVNIIFSLRQQGIVTVMDTPEAEVFATDTPALEFTGTDELNADPLEYFLEVGTNNTFGTTATVASYSDAATDSVNTIAGVNYISYGECFECTSTTTLYSATFILSTLSTPPLAGLMYAEIYAMTGSFGTTGKPTGSRLAVSDPIDTATLTDTFTSTTFNFSKENSITLSSSTYYCIVLTTYTGSTYNGYIMMQLDNTGSYAGNACRYSSGSWTAEAAIDVYFTVTGVTPSLTIQADSETDAGFINLDDGADTHPFTSGDAISYTVQSGDELANGTYYWRYCAKAPAGDDYYSQWSGTRSFEVTSGGYISTFNNVPYADVATINSVSVSDINRFN